MYFLSILQHSLNSKSNPGTKDYHHTEIFFCGRRTWSQWKYHELLSYLSNHLILLTHLIDVFFPSCSKCVQPITRLWLSYTTLSQFFFSLKCLRTFSSEHFFFSNGVTWRITLRETFTIFTWDPTNFCFFLRSPNASTARSDKH